MNRKDTLFPVKDTADCCPECGALLQIKQGKRGLFLGCSAYPTCHYLQPVQARESVIVKSLDGVLCTECGQTMVLRQGRYGMFISCSAYPSCEYTQSLEAPTDMDITCPQCLKGHLVQRRSRYGKTFYGCNHYPSCQFIINFKPVQGECSQCHYPLLQERKTAQGIKQQCASKCCGAWVVLGDDKKQTAD
ncbi:MAG: topoisomerase DNA-binding C4 zinc finger domain-containing protein [Plesiomonas sp.]|uniref:DNA topoisomerase family protein n=1 Tax=Plesiomonas sp. TaxID=2486279 RepID=UPI003F30CC31